jgi:hypothetical protein
MEKFTAAAQAVIDRLVAINYDEPYWNPEEVIKCFERQYRKLGVKMPEVEIADDMLIGFKLATDSVNRTGRAWGAKRGAARGAAWDAAWDAAWGATRDATWGAARDATQDAAQDAAWGAARGAARDATWGAAQDATQDAAWGATQDAAWGATWGAARDAAWDAAWGATFLNVAPDDPKVLEFIEISNEELKAMENGLGVFFPMEDRLILVPIPRMIIASERLHYDHGMAVQWGNGVGFYFIRGVQFDVKLYNRVISQEMTTEDVLTISNADQRAAAISMLRPDRLLEQMKAELIDTGTKGTKLYRVRNFMGTRRTEYCMWMKDASTDREFIEWVEPKVGELADADLCQATAYGISKEQYLAIELEG